VTKLFGTWLTANPINDKVSPYPLFGNRLIRIMPYLGSVVKLSMVRGRTSINWPSNSREESTWWPRGNSLGRSGRLIHRCGRVSIRIPFPYILNHERVRYSWPVPERRRTGSPICHVTPWSEKWFVDRKLYGVLEDIHVHVYVCLSITDAAKLLAQRSVPWVTRHDFCPSGWNQVVLYTGFSGVFTNTYLEP
jgi:hypothetical protein